MRIMSVSATGSAALLALIAGCGPKSQATTPDPGASGAKLAGPTETNVKPMGTRAEAKKQDQALILGTKNGAVVIPLAGAENVVEISPLSFIMGDEHRAAVGHVGPVLLTTTPSSSGKVRVGVYEQFAGSIGEQTRAATWLAAFLAATTLGKDMTDFRFASESAGFRDGPSAGGLMTAGFLASMTGTPIDPTVTMTGTVNPDGTIGPVGGIPQKFAAGAAAGKTKLGYPVGQRYDEDMNTKQMVDLKQVARDNGAEAFEVTDIYAAYTLLTGKTLPRPEAIAENEMAIGDEVEKKLGEAYADWLKLYTRHEDQLRALFQAGNLPRGLVDIAIVARDEKLAAEKLQQQGLPATAYLRIVRATVYAAAATSVSEVLAKVQAGDVRGAYDRLQQEIAVEDRTIGAINEIAKLVPTTIGDHLLSLSAYQAAVAGWGSEKWALTLLGTQLDYLKGLQAMSKVDLSSEKVRDELIEKIARPILSLTMGEAGARLATESLAIEAIDSLGYRCSIPNAKALATSFASAAAANTAYFESLFLTDISNQLDKSEGTTMQILMAFESRYRVAKFAFQIGVAAAGEFKWGEDDLPMVLLTMGASLMSYLKSSSVIAEWYSLGVERDPRSKAVISVAKEKAFINMLTQAEQKAREHANEAKAATGQVPIQSRIHFQNAQVLRNGSLADRLDALEEYWWASAYSQVAVMLARN